MQVPGLAFFKYNLLFDVSRFYGVSPWHYHLTQSLPILLTTAAPFSLLSFGSILLGKGSTSIDWKEHRISGGTSSLRILAIACSATIFTYSLIPHKEWRFLHPILPVLLIFAAHNLAARYRPISSGGLQQSTFKTLYSGLRIPPSILTPLLLIPLVPYIYLSFIHGRAQVRVAEWLAQQAIKNSNMRVLFAMPCHSTPWMSHIHVSRHGEDNSWHFLTCEPPLQ